MRVRCGRMRDEGMYVEGGVCGGLRLLVTSNDILFDRDYCKMFMDNQPTIPFEVTMGMVCHIWT